jgi:predicted nucleotidyltransferase
MNRPAIESLLRQCLPGLLAIYAFGSRIDGTAGPNSDLDLAVLVPGYADPVQLWELAGDLADLAGCPVDLLDFRAASTVMQYRILSTGERCWAADSRADLYEAGVLSDKTELDAARAELLADVQREGSVYGR